MSKKAVLTTGIIGFLAVALLVTAGCGLKQEEPEATQEETTEQTEQVTDTTTTDTAGTTTDTTATTTSQVEGDTSTTQVGSTDLITLAEKFVADYGTFSSQGNFQNITSLYSYMSENLRQQMATFVAEKQAQGTSGGYYEMTTTVMMSKVLEEGTGTASVLVDTYRESSSSSTGREGKYENALLKFVQESGAWKVDQIEWQGQ